jgi:alkylation response protein AidB-like acyl-CoA dehydrogenase
MDFRLSVELEEFRTEVGAFFREEMAPERTAGHLDPTDLTGYDEAFERALLRRAGERGFLGIHAPVEYGGGGRPLAWKAMFDLEAGYWNAPAIDTPMTLVGPALLASGSDAQKRHWLPPMIRGELLMCIAYSEADAGSDLTRVSTRARRDGEGFVLDGEKALVTAAHKADVCCLIARTDPGAPARRAMSMFLVELSSPGVSVTRRTTLNGWTLGEVRFEGVHLPTDALLGEWNAGWRQMAGALLAERSGMFHLGWAARHVELLVEHVRAGGELAAPRELVRLRLAQLRCELEVAQRFARRVLWRQSQGELPAHEPAVAKVYTTELLQRIAQVATEALGPAGALRPGAHGAPFGGLFAWEYVERIHPAISVGSNELQRTAIATAGLGLPRA